MTVTEILQQVYALSPQEREELVAKLIETQDDIPAQPATRPKTGAEIAAMLENMGPIEFADEHITDPVEWVREQRRKQADRLKPYWDGEK